MAKDFFLRPFAGRGTRSSIGIVQFQQQRFGLGHSAAEIRSDGRKRSHKNCQNRRNCQNWQLKPTPFAGKLQPQRSIQIGNEHPLKCGSAKKDSRRGLSTILKKNKRAILPGAEINGATIELYGGIAQLGKYYV